jgi:hypothetical protein
LNVTWQDESGIHVAPEVDYHRQWQAFALRRNLALFLLLCWPLVVGGLFYLSRHVVHEPVLSLVVMLLWLLAALAAVWWAGEFRCPRCRRRYGALGNKKGSVNLTRGIFDEVCANCKLGKFEKIASSSGLRRSRPAPR